MSRRTFFVTALLAALLIAGLGSYYASAHPDGLEYVAGERGFLDSAKDHLLGDQPLADYGEVGGIPVGIAGIIGVLVTVVIGTVVFLAVSRRRGSDADTRSSQHV